MDFQGFGSAQVEQAGVAFGFEHEVEFLFTVAVKVHSPIGVVGSDGCFDFERARNLEEHFHVRVIVQSHGKGTLHRVAVVDDMVVNAVFHGHVVFFQLGDKFFTVQDFLDVVFLPGQL